MKRPSMYGDQPVMTARQFSGMIRKLRQFFDEKQYHESYPQPRLSIMAACEDPKTVRSFQFNGELWPLSQTSQMHLEYDILTEGMDGVYSVSTSYRDEPDPIPGRHNKIFGMFEFEQMGNYDDLIDLLTDLCIHLGFAGDPTDVVVMPYDELCKVYQTSELTADHETKIWRDFGDVVAITHFPQRTHPFWNMKQSGKLEMTGEPLYNKCDFILYGIETFGSAERSTDPVQMRDNFHSISGGMYAKLLYNQFGKERVEAELEAYLALEMFPRFGGGIGLTRLLRAMNILREKKGL